MMDPIQLRVLWNQLISIANEQAKALRRTAFSPIVREAGDLALAICDTRGRMIVNALTGAPGHMNSMQLAGSSFLEVFPPEKLQPGDQLITNDPWISSAHLFDITVFSPIFLRDRLVCFAATCVHHTDIGGYGLGAGARDIHEEGLWIPPMKLFDAGKPNETLYAIIRRNVRVPEHVIGDIAAQVSCGRICAERITTLMDRQGLEDIEILSDEIIARTEQATRDAIRKLKAGTYHGETVFDVSGGAEITLKAAVSIDSDKGEMEIDFAGSSPASPLGINVCLNYAHSYAGYTIHSCLNSDLPNNNGSFTPVKIKAPEGCILNARYPSPVAARHVVGMCIPLPIMKALAQIIPERVLAESACGVWSAQIFGRRRDQRPFASSMFNYSGGMGARAGKKGLSATSYPSGISAVPIEVLEAEMPIVFTRKGLSRGTGGTGQYPGGDGQVIEFRMHTTEPWILNAIISRVKHPSQGLNGGGPGKPGKFCINGQPVTDGKKLVLGPDDIVTFETPGGGGVGTPVATASKQQ